MPTILIGYGGYGLRVLHSFLSGAAARGALTWDERTAVGSLNERRLESMSLFWIPDTLDLPEQELSGAFTSDGGYELMDDLYAQVEHVTGARDRLAEILADAVEREKKAAHRSDSRRDVGTGCDRDRATDARRSGGRAA